MRRDRRNWKLDRQAAIGFQDALALASCLILEGHRKALARDPGGSARKYVEALALGLDLETGTVAGTAVALSVADSALYALGRLAVSIEGGGRFLGEIDEQLSQIRGSLPGPSELRLDRLLLSGAAVEVAIGRARRSEHRLLLPWWPSAVYQLWGDDRVLRRLDQVMDVADLCERKRLLKEVSLLFAKGSVCPELRDPAVSWSATLSATDEVEQLCAAVLTAIRLEEWHGKGRPYAENADALQIPLARYGLRFERSSDGRGYRIWNEIPDEGGSFLSLERKGSGHL